MLQRLSIKNIALVDSIEANLHSGFNVITGETGSGKSLILSAFSFLLGERADTANIRDGATQASVEATFDIKNPELFAILTDAGIETEGSEFIVKRELFTTGKSRVFINNQQAQLTLLKKIAHKLVLTSNQHAHLTLLSDNAPLVMLDTFGDLLPLAQDFKKAYDQEIKLVKEIEKIKAGLATRQRELDRIAVESKEIETAKLIEGEEDLLDQELTKLSHVDELTQKCQEFLHSLDSDRGSVLEILLKQRLSLDRASHLDPKLKEITSSFTSACTELKEVSYEIKQYISHLEHRPDRFQYVQDRLKTISQLKRKYGASVQEIAAYHKSLVSRLAELENQDNLLDEKNNDLSKAKAETAKLAKKLTHERREKAKTLSTLITKELQELNMPHAIFEATIDKQQRSYHGDDSCTFFLTPNLGEKRIPVKESASGGELARLSLAFQTILLQKLSIPTILFDEIDANIGGHTATIVGKKLKSLGGCVQVISITHFPQVATHADQHFCITKALQDGRTITNLCQLYTDNERHEELERMKGKIG